jgi:hypothetical protein
MLGMGLIEEVGNEPLQTQEYPSESVSGRKGTPSVSAPS